MSCLICWSVLERMLEGLIGSVFLANNCSAYKALVTCLLYRYCMYDSLLAVSFFRSLWRPCIVSRIHLERKWHLSSRKEWVPIIILLLNHSVEEESVAECHMGIETPNSSVDFKKNWCNPCTYRQVNQSRGGVFYQRHAALGKTNARFLCAVFVSVF